MSPPVHIYWSSWPGFIARPVIMFDEYDNDPNRREREYKAWQDFAKAGFSTMRYHAQITSIKS
jgi:hypothetical protein